MKDKGFIFAIGNTNGAPLFYTTGNFIRIYRLVTVAAGIAAALFSAGYFIGRLKRLKF